MGGSYGGGLWDSDVASLEQQAKKRLADAVAEASPHVFISFAYEDLDDVNLFRGQAKNENTDIQFDDFSVKEAFDSKDAEYIKRQIRERIDRSSVTLVYLTNNSAGSKWVNWEIEESLKRGKGVVGFYKGGTPPRSMPRALEMGKCKIEQWSHAGLQRAINNASRKR